MYGRPVNYEYREAALAAFNGYTMRTMAQVEDYLKSVNKHVSYSSTRRLMEILVKEGYLKAIRTPGNNRLQFFRTEYNDFIKIDRMSLRTYIHELIKREFPAFIEPDAASMLKRLMLELLVVSAWPTDIAEAGPPPVAERYIRELERFRDELRSIHYLVDSFLKSDPTSNKNQEKLASEFMASCHVERMMIATKSWMESDDDAV